MKAVPAGTPEPVASGTRRVEVTRCPDGPLLVRGADVVRDAAGQEHRATRPVVALCVCGKSQLAPWCDGTHKVIPKRRSDQQPQEDPACVDQPGEAGPL